MRLHSCSGRRAGFTLIELMIVIAIIGILAAILVPNFVKSRQSALQSSCCENLRSVATAVIMWEKDNPTLSIGSGEGKTQIDIQDLLDGGCLKSTPKCPASGNTYEFGYDSEDDSWYVFCPGNSHGGGENYPRYTARSGLLESGS